jgi:cytochrome d ubiquinol oxidase subunit II
VALDLVPIWATIMALAVFMYVLLDGFDLGVGILYPLAPSTEARTLMMTSVAPVWDGNETWLVMGGAGLFAAFPVAFAILMPALYFPILLLLLGLVFRGVAFEFRMKARRSRSRTGWSAAFFFGSLVAAFAQGLILGNYIHGFEVAGGRYAGTSWDWLKPFALITGLGVVAGYALLGATWLVLKTEGELQAWSRRMSLIALWATAAFIVAVSAYSPFVHERVHERWFNATNWLWLAPLPVATAGLFALTHRALVRARSEVGPFLAALGIFALCYLGLGVSLFPYVVPHVLTLHDAAAVPQAQAFLLVGTLLLLPVILGYTGWSYWVFRGKVTQALGYH